METKEGKVLVWRRYSEFARLHARLATLFPGATLAPFPAKRLPQLSQKASVAERRLAELNIYLVSIFANRQVAGCKEVVDFLEPTSRERRYSHESTTSRT